MDGAPPPETENPCRRPWCAHGWDTSDISSKIGSSQFTTPQKSLFIQRDSELHQNSMTKHPITLPIFLWCGKSSGGNSLQRKDNTGLGFQVVTYCMTQLTHGNRARTIPCAHDLHQLKVVGTSAGCKELIQMVHFQIRLE